MTLPALTRAWDQLFADCREAARTAGPVAGLLLLHEAICPAALPCGPTGYAVVPEPVTQCATEVFTPGGTVTRSRPDERRAGTWTLPDGTFVAVHSGTTGTGSPVPETAWVLGLLWWRLGLTEALLATCLTHLRGRTAGDTPLLMQQLIKGSVADAATEIAEIAIVLGGAEPGDLDAAMMRARHDAVTDTDRMLLRLLGASSFVTAGPGLTAHVSELVAGAAVPAPKEDLT
jgi:hypothetical protein